MRIPFLPLLLAGSLLLSPVPHSFAYDVGCGNPGQNDPCEDDDCPESGEEGGGGDGGSEEAACESGETGSNPINPYRANLNRSVTDIRTFGAAPITFSRHYNSRTRPYTKARWELGTQYTWQHNWQIEVRESGITHFGLPDLIVRYPQGREYYFEATDATGDIRVTDASYGDRMYKIATDRWVIRTPKGWEYEFVRVSGGSSGGYQYLLEYVRNGTGWQWTLTYQQQSDGNRRLHRVTNNYGRYIQLARTAGSNNYWQITSVTTNDGRAVNYGYSTWTPTSETVLTSVTYPTGTPAAAYTWVGADSLTTGLPVLATADDPMQSGSGSRMKYVYNYTASYFVPPYGITNGTVFEERNLVTDQLIVGFPLGSGNYPQILEGNGTELLRKYENGGLLKEKADGEGRLTVYTRGAGGAGFIEQIAHPDGGQTTFTRDFAGRVLTRTNALGGVRTRTYNANGFLLTRTDELGRLTTHTRDPNNRVTRTDHPDGTYETFTYTGTGLLKTHRHRNGFTETRNYDSWGNLVSRVDLAGHTWTYTHTSAGLIASVTDPRTHTTSYQYDWRGNRTRITHPDTTFRTTTYTAYGKPASETNELGHTTTFTYTEYNQLKTVTDPLLRTTTYEYGREPGCGTCGYLQTLSKITLPSGKVTEMHYDASGKLTSRTVAPGTPDTSTTQWTYGLNGQVATIIDPRGFTTTYTYDLLGRQLTDTDPNSNTTTRTYDAVGNLLTLTRADSSQYVYTYDVMNRQLTERNPNNETVTYTYHPDDSLATLKDAKNKTYSFAVDALGRRTSMTYPPSPTSSELWTYDSAGNMIEYRTRSFQTMTCTFDNRNRDVACDWNGVPDVTRTFDDAGRLTSATNGVAALTYTYDDAGQLLSEQTDFGGGVGVKTVGYTYDSDGNQQSVTYPDGTVVEYGYTQRNEVASVLADGPPPLATFTYDAAGNRNGRTLENGTTAAYSYDNAGRLLAITHTNGTGTLASANYGYDTVNRRTTETFESGVTDTYGYDAADQVSTRSVSTGATESFSYDDAGNRTQGIASSLPIGGQISVSYASNNQIANIGGQSASNFNGNLTRGSIEGAFYQFKFDPNNRLTEAWNESNWTARLTCTYDARNRRVTHDWNGTTTYCVYDGWNLIAEYDASGNLVARYVHGPQVDEILVKTDTSSSVYYHANGLGSTVALTDGTGTVVERYAYSTYGVPLYVSLTTGSQSGFQGGLYNNRFLFTGREYFHQVRTYDYRNRAYSADLGRFLQTDPIRFDAGDANLYRYVGNDPVNYSDPLGLFSEAGAWRDMLPDGFEDWFDNELPVTIGATISASGKCLECVMKCSLVHLVGGEIQDSIKQRIERVLKEKGGPIVKKYVKKMVPVVNAYDTITTVWGIADCTTNCARSD